MTTLFKQWLVGSPGCSAEENVTIRVDDGMLLIQSERDDALPIIVNGPINIQVYTSGDSTLFEITAKK